MIKQAICIWHDVGVFGSCIAGVGVLGLDVWIMGSGVLSVAPFFLDVTPVRVPIPLGFLKL